jgi:hypothetical protein
MAFCLIILTALTIVMLSQSILMSENVECLKDKIFDWTSGINEYFSEN